VQTGEAITQLAEIDRLRVRFQAPERTLSRLIHGARVEVRTTAYPDLVLTGQIDVIEPVLESESRSARIVSFVANQGGLLRPGMSADVTVVLGERLDVLTVPSESIFFEGQQAFVFVVNADSTVQRTPVGLGTRLDDVVEIVDGLHLGDDVIRAGHQKLFPGAKVNPVNSQGAETAAATEAGR
jgi:membrane fusion protein (multidrug efflux system)